MEVTKHDLQAICEESHICDVKLGYCEKEAITKLFIFNYVFSWYHLSKGII